MNRMENIIHGCLKNKKEKKTHEIELHNSIQDWVFTTFNGCRKVPGKMPAISPL